MANIVSRVKNILLSPTTEWPVIAGETGSIGELYTRYVMLLAAIPAVCGFIGMSMFGVGAMGFNIKVPIGSALASSVAGYMLMLAMIYMLSWIANALAPTFDGQKNHFNAFKLIAYSYTASMVAGVFMLVPSLWFVGALAGFYSLYLLYKGLPILMKNPDAKTTPYFIILFLCGILSGAVMAALTACLTPSPSLSAADTGNVTIDTPMGKVDIKAKDGKSGEGSVSIKGPGGAEIKVDATAGKDGTVTINAPGAKVEIDAQKLEAFAKQMEAATKKMEEANKGGDPTAALKALAEALKAQPTPAK